MSEVAETDQDTGASCGEKSRSVASAPKGSRLTSLVSTIVCVAAALQHQLGLLLPQTAVAHSPDPSLRLRHLNQGSDLSLLLLLLKRNSRALPSSASTTLPLLIPRSIFALLLAMAEPSAAPTAESHRKRPKIDPAFVQITAPKVFAAIQHKVALAEPSQ